jgi:hypothetical protein
MIITKLKKKEKKKESVSTTSMGNLALDSGAYKKKKKE